MFHEGKVSWRFQRSFSTLRVGVSWIPGAPVDNKAQENTKDSRYVTLLQIAEMVRGGEEVQIIDNNTKEDLTEVTLAQIIYEEQKQKASSRNVPLQTLKELIHQRTEQVGKVLSDLREGPIGRLIPGGKSEPPKAAAVEDNGQGKASLV